MRATLVVVAMVMFTMVGLSQDCYDIRIVPSIDNAVIDGCADTIRLRSRPTESFDEWLSFGGSARLYTTKRDDATIDRQVPIRVNVDVESGDLVLIPTERLPIHRADSPWSIRYVISIDCVNLTTGAVADTSRVVFWKQAHMSVTSEARSLVDSSLLTPVVSTTPIAGSVLFVRDGCFLSADSLPNEWAFNHWSVNSQTIPLSPRLAHQHIQEACWPLDDDVMFTAWYMPEIVSTPLPEVSQQKVRGQNGRIHVSLNVYQRSSVIITDLQGNQEILGVISPGEHHTLPFAGATGRYVLTVLSGRSRVDLPFFYQ